MLKTGQKSGRIFCQTLNNNRKVSEAMKAFNCSKNFYIIDVESKISLLDCFSSCCPSRVIRIMAFNCLWKVFQAVILSLDEDKNEQRDPSLAFLGSNRKWNCTETFSKSILSIIRMWGPSSTPTSPRNWFLLKLAGLQAKTYGPP